MGNEDANVSITFAYASSTAQETERSNKKFICFIFYLVKQTCIYLYEQTCQAFFELQSFVANACYLDLHETMLGKWYLLPFLFTCVVSATRI